MGESYPSQLAIYAGVGENVRLIRARKGMTQTALAAAIGLNRTSIVNIERGKQRFLLHTLYDIAAALEVPPANLLTPAVEPSLLTDVELEHHHPDVKAFVKSVISTLKDDGRKK